MSKPVEFVTLEDVIDVETYIVHLPSTDPDKTTLCGLYGVSHNTQPVITSKNAWHKRHLYQTQPDAKLNCPECINIWQLCREIPENRVE